MAQLYTNGHDKNIGGAEIAANSLVAVRARLIAIKAGYADLAVAADKIVGISVQDKTFDADNITVKKELLNYIELDDHMTFLQTVVGGTIAQANVGTLYDLDANGDIDATTAGTGDQVTLVSVISTTEGEFKIAK